MPWQIQTSVIGFGGGQIHLSESVRARLLSDAEVLDQHQRRPQNNDQLDLRVQCTGPLMRSFRESQRLLSFLLPSIPFPEKLSPSEMKSVAEGLFNSKGEIRPFRRSGKEPGGLKTSAWRHPLPSLLAPFLDHGDHAVIRFP
jgi:hypothetical protein